MTNIRDEKENFEFDSFISVGGIEHAVLQLLDLDVDHTTKDSAGISIYVGVSQSVWDHSIKEGTNPYLRGAWYWAEWVCSQYREAKEHGIEEISFPLFSDPSVIKTVKIVDQEPVHFPSDMADPSSRGS